MLELCTVRTVLQHSFSSITVLTTPDLQIQEQHDISYQHSEKRGEELGRTDEHNFDSFQEILPAVSETARSPPAVLEVFYGIQLLLEPPPSR